MSNPQPSVLAWEDLQTMVSNLTNGESGSLDPTLFTQLINDARSDAEIARDWQVLTQYDTSLTWSPGDTFQTGKSLPANFFRWIEDTPVQVWDGNVQNPTVEPISLIPYRENLWNYSTQFVAAVDYTTNKIYFMGTADRAWTVVLSFIIENGDIVQKSGSTSYSWVGFPAQFHKFLAYDAASRFRLGVNYDDLSARNAEDNQIVAQRIMRRMARWDADLIKSWLRQRDYFGEDQPTFRNRTIQGYPNNR